MLFDVSRGFIYNITMMTILLCMPEIDANEFIYYFRLVLQNDIFCNNNR